MCRVEAWFGVDADGVDSEVVCKNLRQQQNQEAKAGLDLQQ
jgi:hypothetical protein